MSLLPEFWGNPTQRHLLIGEQEEERRGVLQIDFCASPLAILKRGTQQWKAFTWDQVTEELELVIQIHGFCYETSMQDAWVIREDEMSYGTLIVDLEVEEAHTGINHMFLEADSDCDGHGRIGTNEHTHQGVLGNGL